MIYELTNRMAYFGLHWEPDSLEILDTWNPYDCDVSEFSTTIEGEHFPIPQVLKMKVLGTILGADGQTSHAMHHRLSLATKAFYATKLLYT